MTYQDRLEWRLDRMARHAAREHRLRGHTPEVSRTEGRRRVVCAVCGYGLALVPRGEAIYVERTQQGDPVCPRRGVAGG